MISILVDSVKDSPQAGEGSEGFIHFLTVLFKVFPDTRTTIEYILAENSRIVVFLKGSGTHKGEFHGIPPTNKSVSEYVAKSKSRLSPLKCIALLTSTINHKSNES